MVASLVCTTEADARRNKPRRAPAKVAKAAPYSPPYAAMVVDANTGRTLHAVNENALRHPASVTKVMTLYLLFEQLQRGRLKLDSELKISRRAASMAPSKLGLRPGSTIAVEDAIKALITRSANDIACAIGENLAGSEEAFAARMTRKARSLGMTRTVFRNASGLPNPDQVTTARDLTILARAVQEKFPRYYRYFQTRVFEYAGQRIGNHNRLLGRVEGVDGIKTGFTNASGFNLMTSARQDGRHVVAIVLGGRSGASRDNIMAGLIRTNMARAATSGRSSVFASLQQDDDDDDAPVAVRTQLASVGDVETTGSLPTRAVEAPRPPAAPVAVLPPQKPLQPGQKIEARLPFAPAVPMPPSAGDAEAAAARAPVSAPVRTASLVPTPPVKATPAAKQAETVTRPIAVTPWVIQLAAEGDEGRAKSVLDDAKAASGRALARAAPFTEKISRGGTTLYRARFSGFAEADKAQEACRTLKSRGFACFATRS
ncbi:D-alanyl-D-alanine carboxypeptidase [Enterovirga rhinocerotis]|nr:D-alanyl-D-alanine carboxypeptidase [Enterovirga rhinocerotis]